METYDRFRLALFLSTVALIAFCLLHSPECLAEQKQSARDSDVKAREKTDQGLDFVKQENYPAALEAFEEAYRIEPSALRMYNIAMCKKALYRYVEAIAAFREFLEKSEGASADMRKDAEDAIAEMERLIGRLKIEGAPDGAKVLIDDKEVARTPLGGPILLDPGEHTLRVAAEKHEPLRAELVIKSGSEVVYTAALAPAAGVEPAAAPAKQEERAEQARPSAPAVKVEVEAADGTVKMLGLIGIGAGAATLAGGAITGSLVLSINSDLEDAGCTEEPGCDESKYGDDYDKRENLVIATNVLLCVGGALTVAGGVMLVLSYLGEETPSDSAASAPVALAPAVGAGFAGAVLKGRF